MSRDALLLLAGGRPFITDGGLETTLIFRRGIDLPCFAAFDLLKDDAGREELREYFRPYLALAHARGVGFLLDTATWRANPDWGERLGYSPDALRDANRRAVRLAEEIRGAEEDERTPIVIDGCVGPRGDGYEVGELMSTGEAEAYHRPQVAAFGEGGVDMVTGLTMTYAEEAVGVVRAARGAGLPAVVSFTVETDGRLPSGQSLPDAIAQVDAETGEAPMYFMVNCAHPTHLTGALEEEGAWRARIGGLRANASAKSHAELDEAEELDEGDPVELGAQHGALRDRLSAVTVLGGCCGTDHRHVGEVCAAWVGG
jgi:homocysteine S-methyltransferase